MKAKLQTPKIQMSDSSKDTLKQFLLSLVATTISIVLTCGTAAWVDNQKKAADKREMVMMILYDLAGTLEQVEKADSLIHAGFEKQLEVAANPKLLEQNPFTFVWVVPTIEYTETVERIFSSNVETINTIGNVFFSELVSDFFHVRKMYKEEICDKFVKSFEENEGYKEYDKAINIDYPNDYIYMSGMFLNMMKYDFNQCQQMMDISNEDLDAFHQKRNIRERDSVFNSTSKALLEELSMNHQRLIEAVNKGKN